MSEAEFNMQKQRLLDKSNMAKNRPYGYYELLEIPHKAKVKDIKRAYFKKAKLYHPDAFPKTDDEGVYRAEIARIKFDEITEAYQTLMDLDQRSFYDRHGYPSEALKQKEMPDIFNYVPKFSIYEEEILADNETTAMEDWMEAQGHSTREQKLTFKQRLKNFYIEVRWAWEYYNFPWNWATMCKAIAGFGVFCATLRVAFVIFIQNRMETLPENSPHRPRLFNDMYKDDDPRDILSYLSIRKRYPSDASRGGMYHLQSEAKPKKERDPDVPFSQQFFSTMKDISSFSKNRARHEWLKFEQRLQRVELLLKQQTFYESRIGMAKTVQQFRANPDELLSPEKGNEFVDATDKELMFKVADLEKQLSAVQAELETIKHSADQESKLALPAKFST